MDPPHPPPPHSPRDKIYFYVVSTSAVAQKPQTNLITFHQILIATCYKLLVLVDGLKIYRFGIMNL